DAITICLKSSQNKLSTWKVSTEEEDEINHVSVAMLSQMDGLDTTHYVLIDEGFFLDNGIDVEYSSGDAFTIAADCVDLHANIKNLNYEKYGYLAEAILEGIHNSRTKTIQKSKAGEILLRAIAQERFTWNDLNEKLRSALIRHFINTYRAGTPDRMKIFEFNEFPPEVSSILKEELKKAIQLKQIKESKIPAPIMLELGI
ncbi:MAG: hypothetical protein RLN85_20590, partial [Pseudomonadales bacterium]